MPGFLRAALEALVNILPWHRHGAWWFPFTFSRFICDSDNEEANSPHGLPCCFNQVPCLAFPYLISSSMIFPFTEGWVNEYHSNEKLSEFVSQTEPRSNTFLKLSGCYSALKDRCSPISLFFPTTALIRKKKGLKHSKKDFLLWVYTPSPLLLFLLLLDSLDQVSLDLLVLKVISPSFKHAKSFIASPFEKCVEFLLHLYSWSSLQICLRGSLHQHLYSPPRFRRFPFQK